MTFASACSPADDVYGCGTNGRRLSQAGNAQLAAVGDKIPSQEELDTGLQNWCIDRAQVKQAVSGWATTDKGSKLE